MPITLAQASLNVVNPVDLAVIDMFRRYDNLLLDLMVWDDVASMASGGGGAPSYTYTRLLSAAPAGPRKFNSEYVPGKATRGRVSVDLKVYGGSYELDRVFKNLGPATTNEIEFQTAQLVTSTRVTWSTDIIRGDSTLTDGFDGLSKILTGAATEVIGAPLDLRAATITTQAGALAAWDAIDVWLSSIMPPRVSGQAANAPGALPPGQRAILGNTTSITRLQSLARWAGVYNLRSDELGRKIQDYNGWLLIDIGNLADDSGPIIPIGVSGSGETDLYAVTFGMDGLHGASMAGVPLIQTWLPDFTRSGAVKLGEVEMGPAALVLKNTKAAGVYRKVRVI